MFFFERIPKLNLLKTSEKLDEKLAHWSKGQNSFCFILTQWMSIQSNGCQFIDLGECTKERI